MASKQIIDNKKSADYVIAAANAHADAIGRALGALCAPQLGPSETSPDFAAATRLLGRTLRDAADRMVQADQTHSAELSDDAEPRELRDQAMAALVERLVELREIVTGLYGLKASKQLFRGPTPHDDPAQLLAFAREVASALRASSLPAPRVTGASIDPSAIAAALDAASDALSEQVGAVVREVREAQATLEAKNLAVAEYERQFSKVANLLSALLAASGNAELAAKVRPSSRRPGQIEAPPAPTAEAGATTASATEPA